MNAKTKQKEMDNRLFEHEFEPTLNSRFIVEFLDKEGDKVIPSYLLYGLSDQGNDAVEVSMYVAISFDMYKEILNEDVVDQINLYWLDPTGCKTHSLTYNDVELESFTFNDLYWKENEEDEDFTKFKATYSFSNKKLNQAYED